MAEGSGGEGPSGRPTGKDPLRVTWSGEIVKHLGLKMYSGPVPALTELIANAWDADAQEVEVSVPFADDWGPTSTIEVADNGHGMSYAECQDLYLKFGADRRRTRGEMTRSGKRLVMGRKGIGKLAGFGIANVLRIRTVGTDADGARELTEFELNYEDVVDHAERGVEYEPPVLNYVSGTRERTGTVVTLSELKLGNPPNETVFSRGMARRFTVLKSFVLKVNGSRILEREDTFQYRFPGLVGDKNVDEIPGAGTVRWWIGFTKDPIPDAGSQGVSVLARGKLCQEQPFFFGVSGGVHGQFGLSYMTGEVEADFLDDKEDLITTYRGAVQWHAAVPSLLLAWGQDLIKRTIAEWARARTDARLTKAGIDAPELGELRRLPPKESENALKAVDELAADDITDEEFVKQVKTITTAYLDPTQRALMEAFVRAGGRSFETFVGILDEFDVFRAVRMGADVAARVRAIQSLSEHIEAGSAEFPTMQKILENDPWLLRPGWDILQANKAWSTIIHEHFDGEAPEPGRRKRPDFFCLEGERTVVLVELKRPGEAIGQEDLQQIKDDVDYLRAYLEESTAPEHGGYTVSGYLIGGRIWPRALNGEVKRMQRDRIYAHTWTKLRDEAIRQYAKQYELYRDRVPQRDPRLAQADLVVKQAVASTPK